VLRQEVDELICLAEPAGFGAVGRFYIDFHQLEDAEVVDLLDRAKGFGAPA
jgi:predicted phosphoribosyltransferase